MYSGAMLKMTTRLVSSLSGLQVVKSAPRAPFNHSVVRSSSTSTWRASAEKSSSSTSSGRVLTLKKRSRAPLLSSSSPPPSSSSSSSLTSSLETGEPRLKSDLVFEARGDIEETSAIIGIALEHALETEQPFVEQLQRCLCILQDISIAVATPNSALENSHFDAVTFNHRHTEELEEWIEAFSEPLPPIHDTILPGGGGKTSSYLHLSRCVCRRAERRLSSLVSQNEVDAEALLYVNKLADFLFVASRVAARHEQRQETLYLRPPPKDHVLSRNVYVKTQDGVWKRGQRDNVGHIDTTE